MASNIGIDFGSTYSMFSYYNEVDDTVNGIQTENGSKYIPSVACTDQFGDLLLGEQARNEMRSDPSLTPFRAFKMLLHELDQEKVKSYGYQDNDPRDISAKFLKNYLDIAAEEVGTQQFDSAVICVPEHWTSSCVSMSGRSVLLDICKKFKTERGLPLLKKLRVVTEPVAATAFYAYNYRREHNDEPFVGEVIVVDYGGGTLDVTLTSVTTDAKNPGVMEIDAIYRTGVGENHNNGQIGDAGLAYMEEVTRRSLADAGFPAPAMDGNFLRAKDALETALIQPTGTKKISDRIKQKYALGMKKMAQDQEVFAYVPYRGKKVNITYGTLYNVFQDIIRPHLETCLGKVILALMPKKENESEEDVLRNFSLSKLNRNIKLAIVGGFGQFPLVQKAVWEIFRCSNTALDFTLEAKRGSRQDAISYGAALIAAEKVSVKLTSKYSIGLRRVRAGKRTFRFALFCGQSVNCSEIYPLCDNDHKDISNSSKPWESILYQESDDPDLIPWVFAVNDKADDFSEAICLTPQPDVLHKLAIDVRNAAGLYRANMKAQGYNHVRNAYYFSFSMDESEIYHLHIYPTHPGTGKRDPDPLLSRPLGDFPAIFGPGVSLEPKIDPEKNESNVLTYIN